ncbi:MAG: Flavoprotein, HI0933 family [Parcubacteria group bacterium GW2011_GWD2_38_12]|nr:MAG: Flavoprotein, HI0933 family [Parcubacteria group bacterium GW2011_GWD2_38_12]KKQ59073.1 MAG: Flavoprotein, HI0933 family [Parcubacteria group bacterium GW2011_GWC1_38_17]KKQ59688.1 MAG: Flavoprotein, HI0933 family [Parcubacteria group bacterium GW2011_GWD1_38_16]
MDARNQTIWDIAIIGGGPAGMMAAGRAAELGAKVILIEKNESLGEKLLLTGGGRCNLTNAEFDTRKFLAKFKEGDKFLFSTFSQFGVKETLYFFHSKNMPTKIEEENRVFPMSDKAESVWDVLVQYMKNGGVNILSDSPVVNIIHDKYAIEAVKLKNGKKIKARSFILATGGKSRPDTGSTGDGFVWLKEFGHKIIKPSAALVPIAIKDDWVKQLSGLSLPNVRIKVLQFGQKQEMRTGKILFTHFGLSGPAILNMSKDIGELLKYGDVSLLLDLFPHFDHGKLDLTIQELFTKQSNKQLKNCLGNLLPSTLVPIVIKMSGINPETFCHSIHREERLRLGKIIKDMPMQVSGLLGVEKAIITSGGVTLEEVDFKTMSSRLYPNLYLVGDILNVDRPSGGYSLQLCWTTGFVAGTAATNELKNRTW